MKSQKGFTAVEGLLIVLVLAVVGFGGFYVWDRQKTINQESSSLGTDETTVTPSSSESQVMDANTKISYSKYNKDGYEFEYAETWKLNDTVAYPLINSPDFKSEGLQTTNIIAGSRIYLSKTDIAQPERNADNFQTWSSHSGSDKAKVLLINNKKVVQFEAKDRPLENNSNYGSDRVTTIFFKNDGTRIDVTYEFKINSKDTYLETYQHVLDTLNY